MSTIRNNVGSDAFRSKMVRGWIFALLRFAITHDAEDQTAALAVADRLDVQGPPWRGSSFHFFVRTTNETCRAIVSADDPAREESLRRLVARIGDQRLARAFEVAVEIEPRDEFALARTSIRRSPKLDLWRGLVAR